MEKTKNIFYKHRYGLFFFVFLMAYSFIVSGDMQVWKVDDITYSFHVVDFSLGFCTKLLPGAVCNLLFGELTRFKVSVYLNILIAICYFIVSLLLEKILLAVDKEHRKTFVILFAFFLTGPATFSIYTDAFCWLDFYWLFAAVLALVCLCKKQLYVFVLPLMLVAVMVHFASILCYVPFIAIIMLYKISCTDDKKEKTYLWIIWVLTVVSALGLTLYMVVFEVENVTVTMEEMNSMLEARGVMNFKYYDFAFFRDEVADKMPEYYTAETLGVVNNIDMTQSPVKIFFDMIMQQIYINVNVSTIKEDIKHIVMIAPVVFFLYRVTAYKLKRSSDNRLKQFSVFCAMALFFVTLFFGYLFSTDNIRWLSHSLTPLFAFLLYMYYKEGDEYRNAVTDFLSKIPATVLICYLSIYAISVN